MIGFLSIIGGVVLLVIEHGALGAIAFAGLLAMLVGAVALRR